MTLTSPPDQAAAPSFYRVVLTLCAVSFIGTLNLMAIGPFLVDMAEDLDSSVALLGQTSTATIFFGAVVGLLAGPLADHYGHRRMLMIGFLALIASTIGVVVASSYTTLLLARLIGGISGAVLPGVSLGICGSRFQGDQRRKAMSWTIAALSSAGIVGVPALAAIGDALSWRWVFAIVAVTAVAGLVLVRLMLPADATATGERFHVSDVLTAYTPLLHHRPSVMIFIGNALRGVTWVGSLSYISAFLIEERDYSVTGSGLAVMVGASGYFAGSLAAGGRLGNHNLRMLFGMSTIVMALSMALIFLLPIGVLPLAALFLVAGTVGAFGWVALTTLLISTTPAPPATTMVFNGAVMNTGSALGALTGGLLLAFGGYGAIGIGLLAFGVVSAMFVWQPDWRMMFAGFRPRTVE